MFYLGLFLDLYMKYFKFRLGKIKAQHNFLMKISRKLQRYNKIRINLINYKHLFNYFILNCTGGVIFFILENTQKNNNVKRIKSR